MKNFISIFKVYLNKVLNYSSGFVYFVRGSLLFLISLVLVFLFIILYKKVRRKFPVKVNCWFCNTNTKVPYDLYNCWDCPNCHQYNGFNKDGDYNKVIKHQYNEKLNEDIFNTLKTTFSKNNKNLTQNGLCRKCNLNQRLKIQQLALFVPIDENKFIEEIEQYREKLEKAYCLCSECEKTLQETLEKQEYHLLQNRLNNQKLRNPLKDTINGNKIINIQNMQFKLKKIGVTGLKWASLVLAVTLFIALILQFETENRYIYLKLPHLVILEPLKPVLKVLLSYQRKIYAFGKELSFAGFFFSLIFAAVRKEKTDQVNLILWGLLHILFWSKLTGFQAVMSGISLFFNIRIIHNKIIYLKKKPLPKKFRFQPESRIFPESVNFVRNEGIKTDWMDANSKSKSFDSFDLSDKLKNSETNRISPKLEQTEEKTEKKKMDIKKESEVELLGSEVPIETPVNNPSSSTNIKSTPLNSSVFSKSFLSTLGEDKVEETNSGPLDEVYNNLNGLHLGGKQKKSKPPNFLFSNYNLSEKKNFSSIIKPAKLVKNVSGSWAGTESHESASRSSTPSSGYSSQKAEKIEPIRYDFSKTLSPISVNPFSRPNGRDCFDYYEGHNGFYNNFNCFSPGFVPFQQFSNPLSHTTIYTCTRPTNFPFPFPWQGFPQQKYSPSSPRCSDASECENLFQNASRSFETSKKWFKLKTISYYFSIFLNVITLGILMYLISAGIISVGWNLPKLNFFF